MFETILLICSLLIVAPFLMILIVLHNMTRVAKGLKPVNGPTALKEIIKNLFKKAEDKVSSNVKLKSKKDEIEDAEFFEIEEE
ncbi:hypothetical protein KC669_04510 [Candidatus Dojkabacteria bacterium]|uniref:DUF4834 family protein n=1 Tax=Candidatus Dojkabacteria bacterium TaxID=2099670 RepID=A0A955RME3_9BACT|nr:hypothetical protein [Candidatus Dojkabacteria bacterium]